MPVLARDVLGLVVGLDDENLRVIGNYIWRGGVHVQFAEAPSKILMLLDADLLVAEEDDEAIQEGIMHFLELLIAKRPGQVDTEDFCTDVRRQLADLDGLVVHRISLVWGAVIPDSLGLDVSRLDDRPPFVDSAL